MSHTTNELSAPEMKRISKQLILSIQYTLSLIKNHDIEYINKQSIPDTFYEMYRLMLKILDLIEIERFAAKQEDIDITYETMLLQKMRPLKFTKINPATFKNIYNKQYQKFLLKLKNNDDKKVKRLEKRKTKLENKAITNPDNLAILETVKRIAGSLTKHRAKGKRNQPPGVVSMQRRPSDLTTITSTASNIRPSTRKTAHTATDTKPDNTQKQPIGTFSRSTAHPGGINPFDPKTGYYTHQFGKETNLRRTIDPGHLDVYGSNPGDTVKHLKPDKKSFRNPGDKPTTGFSKRAELGMFDLSSDDSSDDDNSSRRPGPPKTGGAKKRRRSASKRRKSSTKRRKSTRKRSRSKSKRRQSLVRRKSSTKRRSSTRR